MDQTESLKIFSENLVKRQAETLVLLRELEFKIEGLDLQIKNLINRLNLISNKQFVENVIDEDDYNERASDASDPVAYQGSSVAHLNESNRQLRLSKILLEAISLVPDEYRRSRKTSNGSLAEQRIKGHAEKHQQLSLGDEADESVIENADLTLEDSPRDLESENHSSPTLNQILCQEIAKFKKDRGPAHPEHSPVQELVSAPSNLDMASSHTSALVRDYSETPRVRPPPPPPPPPPMRPQVPHKLPSTKPNVILGGPSGSESQAIESQAIESRVAAEVKSKPMPKPQGLAIGSCDEAPMGLVQKTSHSRREIHKDKVADILKRYSLYDDDDDEDDE